MSDYFSALLRAASTPPGGRGNARPVAPGAALAATPRAEVFDPFDAAPAGDAQDLAASPSIDDMAGGDGVHGVAADGARRPDATAANAQTPQRPQRQTHAANASAPQQPVQVPGAGPALGRRAHPGVQAALRWVAAGAADASSGDAAHAMPQRADATAEPPSAPDASTTARTNANAGTARLAKHAAVQADAAHAVTVDAHAAHRTSRSEAQADQPRAALADGRTAPSQHQAARSGAAPQRPGWPDTSTSRDMRPPPRAEVHIGTLHVTLDAAASARFAAKPAAPSLKPAPRAFSRPDTRRGNAGANGTNGANSSGHNGSSASALSRSRLPRI